MMVRKNSCRGGAFERGATMLEFTIAFPVLIIFCIGLFDFSRVILVKTILRNGALRAAELATVIQNLELEDDVAHPERKQHRQEALLELYRRAVELPVIAGYAVTDEDKFAKLVPYEASERLSLPANSQVDLPPDERSLSAVKITLPDPSLNIGMDINQVFQENPIKIELNGVVKPFLPIFAPVRFTERIEVYREPRNIATKPVKLDCNGDPAVPGKKVVCPCPPAGPGLPAPPNMVLNDDQTSCVCKDTYSDYTAGAGCQCDAAHDEKTDASGSTYCACRLGACPMDPSHPDDPALNQNFSLKECRCVDSDCPPGTIVREDGTCGGCNIQNCTALGPGYVPDPNDDCACKTCDLLFGANPPRIAVGGTCVCANRDTDKPNCTDTQIWSDQQCKCVPCGGNFVADAATHTKCECTDESVRRYAAAAGLAPGQAVCNVAGGNSFFNRDSCQCESCVYGYHADGKFHIAEQTSGTDVGNVDGHSVPYSCECNAYSTLITSGPLSGTCGCNNTTGTCPPNEVFDSHFCMCRPCAPDHTLVGNYCACNNLIAANWDPVVICPAGQAFHGGGCWCYDCWGYAKGYSDKCVECGGWVCKCTGVKSQADCPPNTRFIQDALSGCDCLPCTAADYQRGDPSCVCNPATSGCSNTQSVDSTCQCQDCPPCQVRDPAHPSQCMNPCGGAGDRCVNDGLCCLNGQHVVTGPSGKVCVAANSLCETNPFSASCTSNCTATPMGSVCQLVQQE